MVASNDLSIYWYRTQDPQTCQWDPQICQCRNFQQKKAFLAPADGAARMISRRPADVEYYPNWCSFPRVGHFLRFTHVGRFRRGDHSYIRLTEIW